MPLQNRVRPDGEIVATSPRGLVMGNRGGCLHDDQRRLGQRRWVSRQWICCVLDFNGRQRTVMAPRRYTELFFLDEVTALAAGHRPCFECRRADALRFAELWAAAHDAQDRVPAGDIDRVLHAERLAPGGAKRTFRHSLGDLTDGVMVRQGGTIQLLDRGRLLDWTAAGYGNPRPLEPRAEVEVLTPPGIIAVLKLGYMPLLHESACVSR